jgi:MFS family permease
VLQRRDKNQVGDGVTPASQSVSGLFTWWRDADVAAKRAFVAAALGWMLDSFDVMLYAIVLAALIDDPSLGLTTGTAGLLGSLTLVAAAVGGIAFGVIADRLGRKRALMAAVVIYSIFTAACGLAQTVPQLAVFRILLGLGMGGEWATGAALVSESFPARHRGKALAFVQSTWALGYGLAALVNLVVMPVWGWRGVFLVGVLPALFTLWIRRRVEEPAIWHKTPAAERGQLAVLFAPAIARTTFFITLMNAFTLFGWWGLNSWVPAYLSFPDTRGGIGLSSSTMSLFVMAMQVGMWLGYVSFGFIADAIGRKRAYVFFLITASVLLPVYGFLKVPWLLLLLGPLVAFFGTGYYSGFGAVIVELYPTAVRATAAGFCYNTGRIASAAAPYIVGTLASAQGFGAAFAVAGAGFLLAALAWIGIPETGNRELI